jgi:hypothetical protein
MENIGNIIKQRKDDETGKSQPLGTLGHLGEVSSSEMIPTESDKENMRNMRMNTIQEEKESGTVKGEEKSEGSLSGEEILGERKGKEVESGLTLDERILIPSQLPQSSEEKGKRDEKVTKEMGCLSFEPEEKEAEEGRSGAITPQSTPLQTQHKTFLPSSGMGMIPMKPYEAKMEAIQANFRQNQEQSEAGTVPVPSTSTSFPVSSSSLSSQDTSLVPSSSTVPSSYPEELERKEEKKGSSSSSEAVLREELLSGTNTTELGFASSVISNPPVPFLSSSVGGAAASQPSFEKIEKELHEMEGGNVVGQGETKEMEDLNKSLQQSSMTTMRTTGGKEEKEQQLPPVIISPSSLASSSSYAQEPTQSEGQNGSSSLLSTGIPSDPAILNAVVDQMIEEAKEEQQRRNEQFLPLLEEERKQTHQSHGERIEDKGDRGISLADEILALSDAIRLPSIDTEEREVDIVRGGHKNPVAETLLKDEGKRKDEREEEAARDVIEFEVFKKELPTQTTDKSGSDALPSSESTDLFLSSLSFFSFRCSCCRS